MNKYNILIGFSISLILVVFTSCDIGLSGPGGWGLPDDFDFDIYQFSLVNDQPVWSPDGSKIAFISVRDSVKGDSVGNFIARELYIMNPDGSDQNPLTNNFKPEAGHVWSPNSEKIAFGFGSGSNLDIYVINFITTGLTNLTNNPPNANILNLSPAWSPDGSKIAFVSSRNNAMNIYIMNADGSNLFQLTNDSQFEHSPIWHPDGSKILYSSGSGVDVQIFVIDINGTNKKLLAEPGWDYQWFPDGSKILYGAFNVGMMVMDSDGSNQTILTASGGGGVISNDGSKIVYSSVGISIMNSDGTNQSVITNVSFAGSFSWSPDDSKIVFESGNDIYVINSDGSNITKLTGN